jgi:methionine-rich copper-binding protein CopC
MKKQAGAGRRITMKLAVFGIAITFAGLAFAHVFPKKQEPGAGVTVAAPPAVTITFDGPLEPAFSTLTVTDASGKQVSLAKASVDPQRPTVMSVALPALASGRYTVHWAAVASDGHRTHGDYKFDVK